MKQEKSRFALFFGNRGFFPASLQASARRELSQMLQRRGHKTLMLEAGATRNGAVETPEEGEAYANFLKRNAGKYDGVIVCLPNFGDETGAVAALSEANTPILIQAYPDEMDKLDPARRRDSFCGKFSIMDVFSQYGVKFTALKPHVAHPCSAAFADNVVYFDRLCRTVKASRKMIVGAIGARTTAFKTVRIDEVALQRHGITMETVDMSDVFARMRAIKSSTKQAQVKAKKLSMYTCWKGVPKRAFEKIVALGVVLDGLVEEMKLDALAIRCWLEMQQQFGISCCVLLSEMNERGVMASCEVDVGSAITMRALGYASGQSAACLDWNNNFGDDENKCILFHCGPVPQAMMAGRGQVTDHAILENAVGKGCGYGCNTGRIAPMPVTFGNLTTLNGKMKFYLGEGRFTDDVVPKAFFGCAGVMETPRLQDVLLAVGRDGHRHHVAVTPGHVLAPVREAFEKYLGYEVNVP